MGETCLRSALACAAALGCSTAPDICLAGSGGVAPPLVVTRPPEVPRFPPQIPPPVAVTPGVPLTYSQSSLADSQTRFLTSGLAEARCPGQPVVFIGGVVNPTRPTLPGDGVFMCRGDAVAEGFIGR